MCRPTGFLKQGLLISIISFFRCMREAAVVLLFGELAADVPDCVCCSKLRESMQKQWQGQKGAERLEKFRAQVGRCLMWHRSVQTCAVNSVSQQLADNLVCAEACSRGTPGCRSRGGQRCAASVGRRGTTSGPAMRAARRRCVLRGRGCGCCQQRRACVVHKGLARVIRLLQSLRCTVWCSHTNHWVAETPTPCTPGYRAKV
jgi:hypothetical protein